MGDEHGAGASRRGHPFGTRMALRGGGFRGLGWLRDGPDFRDMTLTQLAPKLGDNRDERQLHQRAAKAILAAGRPKKAMRTKVDNSEWCSPVEDQDALGSCTANACAGMVEYMERRATGRHVEMSRLFLYKVTRNLLGWEGDTGAFLRTTMKAAVLFGSPPEKYWPYDIQTFDREPDAFLYAYAASYKAIRYMRLDPPNTSPKQLLATIKMALALGYVAMFGFTVYSSLGWDADIPFPQPTDSCQGGHAVLAVGYDDAKKFADGRKGALHIRNSWGTEWGDDGYGWLPYDYVLTGLADDFWTCFKTEWVESKQFE